MIDNIVSEASIFEAWSDEPWVNEGSAVRVSIICFGSVAREPHLNGRSVHAIAADLSALNIGGVSTLATPASLSTNLGISFQGSQKIGQFDIAGDLAREWLPLPNPHGRKNSDVVKPSFNGIDVTRRSRDMWIIDFGTRMSEADAALYEAPFSYITEHVLPVRKKNNRDAYRRYWWRHGEPRVAMRAALRTLGRYAAISEKSKHFFFIWLRSAILPDKRLIVIARDDDTCFGIISSRIHKLWALRFGSTLEDRPCYTPTTCFETFPFPRGLTPNLKPADYANPHAAEIAAAAERLNELREAWLTPPEWVDRVPEAAPGYPDRIVAKPGHEVDLKKRTLTNLYNAHPAWLVNAHNDLDRAVADAYGWTDYAPAMQDEEILRRLLALNRART